MPVGGSYEEWSWRAKELKDQIGGNAGGQGEMIYLIPVKVKYWHLSL